MQKYICTVISIFMVLILVTGCSHPTVSDTSSADTSPQFGLNSSEIETTTDAEESSPQETDTLSNNSSGANASAPDHASSDSTPSDESSPEESSPNSSSESSDESTNQESSEAPTETAPEETTRASLNFTEVNETVYATDAVNIRTDYTYEDNIIAVLGKGSSITRIGYHEKWSKVMYNGQECYISSAYLTTETAAPETTSPETTAPETTASAVIVPSYNTEFMNNLSNITFTGRWFTKDYDGYTHYTTLNAGSELSFQISGVDCISVYMSSLSGEDCYFAYSIDGQTPIRQSISQPYMYLGSSGTHTLRIIIDSIGDSTNRWNEGAGVSIDGISFNGGALSSWKYSNTIIAFYGDSITEGIRTLSAGSHSYVSSYTWSCCQALGALPVVCGFPGSGITTTGTFNTCINAISNYSSGRNSVDFSPSVIVLSHGTNDAGVDGATFGAAYNEVLDSLHSKFPNAKIACMIPVSQAHADDIRTCVSGKDWCVAVETYMWNITYTDNIHPDASSSQSMGYQLALALQSLLN